MTDRLYYDDPYCRAFDAAVVRVDRRGDRQAVWLDRSSFYPTSGGQPFDTGTLGDGRVVDVEAEDDDVVHLVEGGSTLAAGAPVRCQIDWPRRFDHMQQHSGQHLLSAAFIRSANVPTLSFHLGVDVSTIDLAKELTPGQIAAAEDLANGVVWENRPVAVRYADAQDAATLGLRKPSAREGTLRLIEVEQFDLSACGGSHVTRTGEIGVIAVTGWERFKGGQRLAFLCGGRALARLRALRDASTASTRLLSVLPDEVPGAIERLQHEARDQKRAIAGLEQELARFRAGELAQSAETVGAVRLVLRGLDGDAATLKSLASAVTASPGVLAVLVSTSVPAVVVVARSPDLALASDGIVKSLVAQFGGRGGGRPDMAQAGGLNGSADEILAEARRLAGGSAA